MSLLLALTPAAFAADSTPKIVKDKTYAVTVVTSFGTTFTDCFRFTQTTLSIDGCGDSGPAGEVPLSRLSGVTGWSGKVPCGGLNLIFIGTSVDAAPLPQGADMIGGTAVGLSEGTAFSVSGIGSETCPSSAVRNGLNYTKGLAAPVKK
ncbi:MAG: hypothetical protein ABI693_34120 [Bryobacteraceae bacterium]